MVRCHVTSSALFACAFSSCPACHSFCHVCCSSACPQSPCHWSESVASLGWWRRSSSSLHARCSVEWSASSPASSAVTSCDGGASSWNKGSWTPFLRDLGKTSPLSHVLVECLPSRTDLVQTMATSKAGLIVCTYVI